MFLPSLVIIAILTFASCSLPHVPYLPVDGHLPYHSPDRIHERCNHIGVMLRMAELSGASAPIAGNRATLLVNGRETFDAMLSAVKGAKDHVNFETYIIDDDEIGTLLADVLIEKQRQGVQVNVIYDSMGSRKTPESFFRRLKDGGVNVLEFNPLNPTKKRPAGQPFYQRNHRKLLIVDGSLAFAGGVNIGTAYYRELHEYGKGSHVWRDSHVRIEGPVAAEFQKLFLDTWAEQDGPVIQRGNYFPVVLPVGKDTVQVTWSKPGRENRGTYVMYVSAIRQAKRYVYLTHAYFVPDCQIMDALVEAARRGVDVRIILPEFNDHFLVLHAGRSFYRRLLEAGVKLYELCCANLHSKTAVIDGEWSTIGSTNLELWSLSVSLEVNAVIVAEGFGREMEAMFAADLNDSRQITLDQWKKRPLTHRIKQGFAALLRPWL